MTKRNRQPVVQHVTQHRKGEYPTVDVIVEHVATVGGLSTHNIAVNMSQTAVPERKYAADSCSAVLVRGTVKLLFGQTRLDGASLRALLIVQMGLSSAARFYESMVSMKDLEAIASQSPEAVPLEFTEEPTQTVELAAGLVFMAVSSSDSCLDCYQASAFSLGAAIHTKKVALDPVVRVELPTACVWSLFNSLKKISPKFPDLAKIKMEQLA
jgi:hypothetical protein